MSPQMIDTWTAKIRALSAAELLERAAALVAANMEQT